MTSIKLSINGLGEGFIARYGNQLGLGGGLPGSTPQQVVNTDDTSEYVETRFILREAWNTNYLREKIAFNNVPARCVTPFRAVNNAGDLLSRPYYSCGGPCQTFQSRPGLRGLRQSFGSISKSCTPSALYTANQVAPGVPAAACNVKFVYDSSDYTTYLKQRAMVRNYNDSTFAGNDSSGSQSAYRAIRRY
jgi:hypothetical protein